MDGLSQLSNPAEDARMRRPGNRFIHLLEV
jgi:hypothetical protein